MLYSGSLSAPCGGPLSDPSWNSLEIPKNIHGGLGEGLKTAQSANQVEVSETAVSKGPLSFKAPISARTPSVQTLIGETCDVDGALRDKVLVTRSTGLTAQRVTISKYMSSQMSQHATSDMLFLRREGKTPVIRQLRAHRHATNASDSLVSDSDAPTILSQRTTRNVTCDICLSNSA